MQGERRLPKKHSQRFDELTSWLPFQTTDEERSLIKDAKIMNHVNIYNRGEADKYCCIWHQSDKVA